jgi:hypothetical protein
VAGLFRLGSYLAVVLQARRDYLARQNSDFGRGPFNSGGSTPTLLSNSFRQTVVWGLPDKQT